MIERFIKRKPTQFEEVEAKLIDEMLQYDPHSEEFTRAVSLMERLAEIQAHKAGPKVSRDTMLIVAGNLLGILVIVAYEQNHAMTSKAQGMLLRPKSSVASI